MCHELPTSAPIESAVPIAEREARELSARPRRRRPRRPRPAAVRPARATRASRGRGRTGAAGPRWRRRADPAPRSARRRAGRHVRSWRRRRRAGPSPGSSPRARSVARRVCGTKTTGRTAGSRRRACVSRARTAVCQAMVRPPARHGATLSGWPSTRVARARTSSSVKLAAVRVQGAGGEDAGDRGRRGGSEAARVRDAVDAADPQILRRVPPRSPYAERNVGRSGAPRRGPPSPRPRR